MVDIITNVAIDSSHDRNGNAIGTGSQVIFKYHYSIHEGVIVGFTKNKRYVYVIASPKTGWNIGGGGYICTKKKVTNVVRVNNLEKLKSYEY